MYCFGEGTKQPFIIKFCYNAGHFSKFLIFVHNTLIILSYPSSKAKLLSNFDKGNLYHGVPSCHFKI